MEIVHNVYRTKSILNNLIKMKLPIKHDQKSFYEALGLKEKTSETVINYVYSLFDGTLQLSKIMEKAIKKYSGSEAQQAYAIFLIGKWTASNQK